MESFAFSLFPSRNNPSINKALLLTLSLNSKKSLAMIAAGHPEVVVPLDLLKANEEASVVDLIGNQTQVHRLAEMGLCVGATVRMIRPGSPCLLALDGKRLSVRLNADADVLVSTVGQG